MQEALISIKPKYVNRILSGAKTVEIRRRRVNLEKGTRLWIYSTLPEGKIGSVGWIKSIEVSNSDDIWNKYSQQMGITYSEYCNYVCGAKEVSAINIENIKEVSPAPTLDSLRSTIGKFYPPQFFSRINENNKLWSTLKKTKLIDNNTSLKISDATGSL